MLYFTSGQLHTQPSLWSAIVTEHWTGMSTLISRAVPNVLIVNSVNEPLTRPELLSLLNRIQCR